MGLYRAYTPSIGLLSGVHESPGPYPLADTNGVSSLGDDVARIELKLR